jgi:Rrf2 family protein
MLLPQTAEYAMRAVLYIGASPSASASAAEMAVAVRVPRNYLAKTLHQLARAGVLTSARGSGGGFRLAVPPNELTLERVIAPFRPAADGRCLLGQGRCGDDPTCAVHTRWQPVAAAMQGFFRHTTIADLIAGGPDAAGGGGPATAPAIPSPVHNEGSQV